jgi:hypothetical protein
MNLAASLIVHDERHRYLDDCVDHLLDFCDQICIIDDGSNDKTLRHLQARLDPRIHVERTEHTFFAHEGKARQRLIDWTLAHEPTHVLSTDADEFVTHGLALRATIEREPDVPVWSLVMEEVWNAGEQLSVREDGGWRSHPLPVLWKAPPTGTRFTMRDRKLACGRVPTQVLGQRPRPTGIDLLHFGWTNPAERASRYARYTRHDGGRFHASAHLKSIVWPESRMRFTQRPWPAGEVFDDLRERFMVTA